MPPLPYVPDVLRADLLWTDASDTNILTRLHYAYTGGPPSPTDCIALATGIYGAAVAQFISALNVDGKLRGVDVVDLADETAATGTYEHLTSGTNLNGFLPAGVAVLMNHHIARRYRGGKPRSYLPLMTPGNMDTPSAWSDSTIAGFNTQWAAFTTAVLALESGDTLLDEFVSVSYYKGYAAGRPRSNGHLYFPPGIRETPIVDTILRSTMNPKPGSQRRRNLH